MAIEAQLADGRVLEFPDDTDPAVIQATVKKMVQAGQPAPAAPTATPAASAASAPARAPVVETAAGVLPTEATDLRDVFGRDLLSRPGAEAKPGFFPGEELVKGVKAGVIGLKSMPSAIGAAGAAESLVAAQNRIALLDKIDAGQITSPRELREQPGFDPRVGMYLASAPEVRAKLRAGVVNDLARDEKFMAASLSAFQKYREEASKLRGRTEEFTDIGSPTDFGNWLSKSIGEVGVQLGPIMLSAIALKQPGLLTTSAGMEFAGGVQNRMEFLSKELQKLPPEQRAERVAKYLADTNDTTAAAALMSGSLDLVLGPAARAAKTTAKELLEKSTRKGAALAEAKRLPKDIAGEFATGAAQEGIQIGAETKLGEQKQPLSWENVKRVINAAAKEAAGAPVGTAINVARAAATRPTVPGEALPPELARVEPAVEETPAATPAAAEVSPPLAVQEQELFAQEREGLIRRGFDEDSASRIAKRRVAEARQQRIQDLIVQPTEDEIQNRAKELVDAGVDPTVAIDEARTQIIAEREADAVAERELGGAAALEPAAGGAGVAVAGRPEPGAPTEGAAGLEPTGVAPAGPATEVPAGREAGAPAALEEVEAEAVPAAPPAPAEPKTKQQVLETATDDELAKALTEIGGSEVSFLPANEIQAEIDRRKAAPAAVPKKRGRPAVLTPEEKAAKAAEKKPLQAVKMKAERAVTRLTKTLDDLAQPIDLEKIESDEALAEAEADRTSNRREAVKELLQLQAAPNLRGTKVGERVKAALAHPSIKPKELADIRAGLELQQRAAESVSRSAVGGAPADSRFNKFANGAQALSHVIKTGNAFQKMLGKRLRPFVAGVKFVVIEQGQELPEQLQSARNAKEWERARALYIENDITKEKVIYARGESFGDDQGVNNVTVLHELLHAATNRKVVLALDAIRRGVRLNDPLVRAAQDLLRTMNSAAATFNDLAREGKLPAGVRPIAVERGGAALTDPREFIAYGMTDENFQKFLMQARGYEEDTSFFNRFVRGLRKLFGMDEDATNALTDLIVVTDSILRSRAPSKGVLAGETVSASVLPEDEDEFGRPIRTEQEVRAASERARFATEASRAFEEGRRTERVLPMLRRLVDKGWMGMSETAIKRMVEQPTFTFLADWSGIPSLKDAEKNVQLLNGMATNLLTGANKVIVPLERALNPMLFAGRKAKLRTDLENLVYETTVARYDPSDPRKREVDARLDRMYRDIGPEGQKLYGMVKDYYADLIDLYSDLLDQQIENLQGVSPEVKKNLMLNLRRTFEAEARIKPYFPLVRHGDYWARVEVDEAPVFLMYESAADRESALREFAKERGLSYEDLRANKKITVGEGQRNLRFRTQGQSAMLTQIFDALDKETFGSAEAKESLKDAVYQIYLATMPEQSFRNQFIRRKDRIGFSTDLIRNISTSASKMSIQLARLKYSPLLRNNIDAAADVAEDRDNLRPFVEEARKRVELVLRGPTEGALDAVAGAANKVGYVMYLSSAASALIQPTALYVTALPVIGANSGNIPGAAKELMKAVGDIRNYGITTENADGSVSLTAPSLANSTRLSADERRAIKAMEDRGIAKNTYASLVWMRQGVSTDYASTTLGKAGKLGKEAANLAIGALMHNVERLTREATFLASYRVNRKRFDKQGMSPEDAHLYAVDQAASDVNEALADYDMSNRPRWMQTAIGRVIGQFKMFPIHTMLLLGTNFVRMLPLLNKEGKAAAFKKFVGIFMTSASIAGLQGIPLFGTLAAVMAWAVSQMSGDDEDEGEKELRETDPATWFRTVFLPQYLGDIKIGDTPLSEIVDTGPLNALTGSAIAERIGLSDLLGRDTKETRTAREGLILFALDHMGPLPSTALNFADAYEAASVGDYQKAAEKITPAFLRNPMIASKIKEEGIKDAKGQVVIEPDQITAWKLFMQRIGFRPAEVARMSETSFRLTSADQRIINERDKILTRIKVQARKESDEGDVAMEKIIEDEVSAFNDKHPGAALDGDDIFRALKADAEKRGSSRYGVTVTERNAAMVEKALEEVERRIERENKKRGE